MLTLIKVSETKVQLLDPWLRSMLNLDPQERYLNIFLVGNNHRAAAQRERQLIKFQYNLHKRSLYR